jgi:N-acetylmuramoyl-L-alanine amidase
VALWWWTISWKKLRIALVIVSLLFLSGSCVFLRNEPDLSTMSYGVAGKIIAIDPGHGGIDPGTIGRITKVQEKDITLKVARKLADNLSRAGALVVMTRTGDADLSDKGFQGKLIERKRQDLSRRVEKAHRLKADMFISIHTNADPSPQWHGAQTFYYGNSPTSKRLAECIQDELVRILGNNNRKAKSGAYFVMEKTQMPAVIVEIGFLSHPEEEKLLIDELYQSKVAYAIMAGIVKYTSEEVRP